MEDMYCDNDYIHVIPTRYSVIIMKETYGPYEGRAEQRCYIPVRATCTTSEVWLVSGSLESVESRARTGLCGRSCMDCAYNNLVS